MTLDQSMPVMIALKGEFDLARSDELEQIGAMACDGDLAIVDMTEVTFLDSTVLAWLVQTKHALEEKSGRLRVIAPNGIVTRLVSIAGLEGVIECSPPSSKPTGRSPMTMTRNELMVDHVYRVVGRTLQNGRSSRRPKKFGALRYTGTMVPYQNDAADVCTRFESFYSFAKRH